MKQSQHKKKYLKYLRSKEWAEISADMITLSNNKCTVCESSRKLEVHHITYDRLFMEEPGDLIVLCKFHHLEAHGIKKKKKRKFWPKKKKNKKPGLTMHYSKK